MTKWIKLALCSAFHSFGIVFLLVCFIVKVRGDLDVAGAILCLVLSATIQLWINPVPKDWIEKEEADEE